MTNIKEMTTADLKAELNRLELEVVKDDSTQHSLKILLNSLYGATGNKWFPYFDLRVAESITSTGQVAIRYIGNRLNEYLNKLLKTDGLDYVCYTDTDSCYVVLDALVSRLNMQDKPEDAIVDFIDKVSKEKLEPFIDQCYRELAVEMNAHSHQMFMKRENISVAGVWCLHPDTKLNGMQIEKLFNSANGAGDIKDVYINTTSFNLASQVTEDDYICALMRKQYTGDMYTFILEDGKTLNVTADHLILCKGTEGKYNVWKKAKHITLEDEFLI